MLSALLHRSLPRKIYLSETSTFMGQLAGAQAVRIVGNSECIKKIRFLKGSEAMLNI